MESNSRVDVGNDDEIDAITLQLREIELYLSAQHFVHPGDGDVDYGIAMLDLKAELEKRLLFLTDIKVAKGIQDDQENDTVAIEEPKPEEKQVCGDKEVVRKTGSEVLETEHSLVFNGNESEKDIDYTPENFSPANPRSQTDDTGLAEPSNLHSKSLEEITSVTSTPKIDCVACGDAKDLAELTRCPCEDLYCIECMKNLFIRSTKDETLLPPRCCGEYIPLSIIEAELSEEEVSDFSSAAVEFSTTVRTYCHQTECGRFIAPDHIHLSKAVCSNCDAETCSQCNGLFHTGDCPDDEALQAVLSLARAEQWRRCFGCNAIVELDNGCNHMTCECSAEFCYLCGIKWKDCKCNIWEERNLLYMAELVVDREANHPIPVRERQHRVALMENELRENHECRHPGRWEKMEGGRWDGFVCEICFAQH